VRSQGRQTILLISNDEVVCAAVRRELESRRPDVRVSAVSSMEAAMRVVEDADPSVILLTEESSGTNAHALRLDTVVSTLAVYAPVVVIGNAERDPRLDALVIAGAADYVSRSRGDGCTTAAIALLERRLLRARRIAESTPGAAEAWEKDFAEVLRHELNNPLTGILGNAELLLAEISRKNDGRLPHGGRQRVETIAALAVRLRETVRQLSHQWEARRDLIRSA
jgi:signal transduction histidine kinase